MIERMRKMMKIMRNIIELERKMIDIMRNIIEMMRKIYGEAMLSNIIDSAEAYATFNIGAELEKIIIISKSDKYSANRSKPKAFKSL